MQPELLIQITKRTDERAVLKCVRADGSVTWQRQEAKLARFFPFHDLTHYAVETTLGFRQGFFGLIADGWDITETTGKASRGRLPGEATFVEHVVGLFDRERVGGAEPMVAADFNAQLSDVGARVGCERQFDDAQLQATRARIDELHRQLAELDVGGTLELPFDRTVASTAKD